MWLSNHSSTSIDSILQWDVEFYEECFEAAQKLWKEESQIPITVIIKGFIKEDQNG